MRYCLPLVCSLVLTGLPASPVAAAESLRLYTWEGYFSETLLQRWAKAHPPVQEIHFDSSDVRDATLARGDADLDLVVINEVSATRLGQDGLLMRIDPQRLPHLSELDPRWRQSCGDYAVPYVWGTLGLLYRSDRLAQAPSSWQSLLQPEPALHGHIAMLEDHDDLLVAPLITLGAAINSDDPELLRRSFALLKAQAPAVLTYQYVVSALQRSHRAGAGLQRRPAPAQCRDARAALALRHAPRGQPAVGGLRGPAQQLPAPGRRLAPHRFPQRAAQCHAGDRGPAPGDPQCRRPAPAAGRTASGPQPLYSR